jgi:hypothetical protein
VGREKKPTNLLIIVSIAPLEPRPSSMQDDTDDCSDENIASCGEGVYYYREALFGVEG